VSRVARRVGAVLVVAAVASGGWLVAHGASAAPAKAADADSGSGTGRQTAAVQRTTLTVTEDESATLGFAGADDIRGGRSGVLTWTVPLGTIVSAGQRLYETNGKDITSAMYGSRPAWRPMGPGMTDGRDVRQLEQNLKRLGYTRKGDKVDNHWDGDTTAAVKRWQRHAKLPVDGKLDLGEVVFLPGAIRVTSIVAPLGSMVGGGGPVLSGTSATRVVAFGIAATDRALVVVGKAVQVELPDGSTAPGKIASVGRVAQTSTDERGQTTTSIAVTVTLDDPSVAGDLDQASVTVTIVRSSRENVLAVPVNALVALREGGYAVEVVDAAGSATPSPSGSASPGSTTSGTGTHLVRVEPGLFDRGNVEITATGIQPGDLVVVPE
jgi:peptidoglycan hydrolase-like protein with peptidoglycan-binding domain